MLLATVAVFDNVPEAGAVPDTSATKVPPLARSALVQVKVPAAIAHPTVDVDGDPKFTGNVSLTSGANAVDGPLFVTVNVYVTDPPAFTDAGPVFTIARSACGVTVVDSVDVLFDGSGSAVVLDTVAVFDSTPLTGAVPLTVATNVSPLARSALVHVNTSSVIAQPTVEVEGDPRLTGNVSDTVGATAVDGPLLVTVSV